MATHPEKVHLDLNIFKERLFKTTDEGKSVPMIPDDFSGSVSDLFAVLTNFSPQSTTA